MRITFRTVVYSVAMLTALSGAMTPAAHAVDEFIDIHPFLKKIPLAIPDFKPLETDEATGQTAAEARDLTAETLAFTSYFKLIDHAAFLDDPKTSGLTARSINFRNWTIIGAELLITGGGIAIGRGRRIGNATP